MKHTCFFGFLLWILFWNPLVFASEILHVGIYQPTIKSAIPKKDFIIGMTVFLKEFTEKEGVKTNIAYYDDPLKLSKDFDTGKVDFIVAEALFLVQYIPSSHLKNGVMAYKRNKKDSHTLVLLEQKDDSRNLKEKLSGTVATDGDLSTDLYLKTIMLENGIRTNADILLTKSPQQSILKLFFGKADLALVDSASYKTAIELNPQLDQKLSILKSVPLTLGPVSYMNRNLNDETNKKIIQLGKKLNTTDRGKQLLQLFKSSYMDESDVQDLENIYALNAKYNHLLKTVKTSTKGTK